MNQAIILQGDVRRRLSELPDESVHCCSTSPPYWGLRDYGTASWDGGDPTCDHLAPDEAPNNHKMTSGQKTSHAGRFAGPNCFKCGARRVDLQIGLEQTPDEYVSEMVDVFREVHRVLADDGVLWLNLGDSYAGNNSRASNGGRAGFGTPRETVTNRFADGLKPKDLVGIPWRVALALQADGWFLRQDIIWHKPNPMPESVTDRCTKAHEYLFMLTKSARYYFDNHAIAEPARTLPATRDKHGEGYQADYPNGDRFSAGERVWGADGTRNRRSVWTIPTKPFKGAHFAVMPEALVEPCILATSRPTDLVFDPFTGSGTVAVVALRHNRNFIGVELNPDYINIAVERITSDQPLFNTVLVK